MSEPVDASRNIIVAATDLEETGEFALREAVRLARQLRHAELHAVYVIAIAKNLHDARKLDELSESIDRARQALHTQVILACSQEASAAFHQAVTLHVRLGVPAEAIHHMAVDLEADMIVVGTHGRSGVKRLVLGSVAEALVRMACAPVVIAHPKHYHGLAKSDHAEPPLPGQDLSVHGSSESVVLHILPRVAHISGLV